MSGASFDEVESVQAKGNDKPIWSMDLDKAPDDQVLQWLNTELNYLEKESEDRLREIKHNFARYKGIQYMTQDTRTANRDRQSERARFSPKLVVNLLALITETRVARELKFKPSVQVVPTNDQFEDKQAAKNAKLILDHIKYVNNIEAKRPMIKRISDIAGECYLDIPWDPEKGDMHPDYDPKNPQPLLDADGKQVLDKDGKPQVITDEVKVGDVGANIILPNRMFIEKTDDYDKADYGFWIEPVMTEKLKRDYQDKSDKIQSDSQRQYFNLDSLEDERLINHTTVVHFVHKKTKYLPKGRMITFTKDVILENVDHKYSHGDFTWERREAERIPGERHARSALNNIKGLAALYNNLTNAIVKNQAIYAIPKWFVPRGAVNKDSLGNGSDVVEFQGGQPPVLGQPSATPAEVFTFRQQIKDEALEQGRIGDVSRGEPPPGITSGVALQYLGEMELQITNSEISSMHDFERRMSQKMLKVAAENYDPSDKRTIMVMGENRNWVKHTFNPNHLARPFDIRMLEGSQLPDSKAQKTQTIIDLQTSFPGILPPEQVLEMLDLGMPEKFVSAATGAVRAAEYENEKILGGDSVPEPTDWELHVQHWMVHTRAIQDATFKLLPPKIQQTMKEHIMAHEMLMLKAAEKNPIYGQSLASLSQFPMLMELPGPLPSMPPPDVPPGGPLPPQGPDAGGAPMGAEGIPPESLAQTEPAVSEDSPQPQSM